MRLFIIVGLAFAMCQAAATTGPASGPVRKKNVAHPLVPTQD